MDADEIEKYFKQNASSITEEKYNEWGHENWLSATKRYYGSLITKHKVEFRATEYGSKLFIEACENRFFVNSILTQKTNIMDTDNFTKLLNALEGIKQFKNWKYDAKVSVPKPSKVSLSKKEKYFLNTSLCLLDKASEKELVNAINERTGLFRIEKMLMRNLVKVEFQERLLIQREQMFKENGQKEYFEHNKPNIDIQNFFMKHTKWEGLKVCQEFYCSEVLELVENHKEIDSYELFRRTLGDDGFLNFAKMFSLDEFSNRTTGTSSLFGGLDDTFSKQWFALFEKGTIEKLREVKSKGLIKKNEDIDFIPKELMISIVRCGQSIKGTGLDKAWGKRDSDLVAWGIEKHLKELTVEQSDSHNPIATIMRLDKENRKTFHPHLLCALMKEEGLLPQLSYNNETLRYDLVKVDLNLCSVNQLIKELQSASLEDNLKYHQMVEKNFEIKIQAHPYLKKMMIDNAMNKGNVLDEEPEKPEDIHHFRI